MQKDEPNVENEKPVKIPIEDVLDLHTFLPKEIPGLLKEYLQACRQANIYSVRIIHGKGKGFLRNRVRGLLKELPMVASFSQAPSSAGGWGATIVELKKEYDFESAKWALILDKGARTMGTRLKQSQIAQFAIHARELMAWNQFANLTAITNPVEVAVKQFLDTLPVCPLPPPGSRVLDIGSGGGFPGIPLKIMRPDLNVTLIDASRKKVNFQKHIIRILGLKDIKTRHIRSEELIREFQSEAALYDVIISKAVSRLDKFLDQAMPLLRRTGIVVAMKAASVEAELEAALPKIKAQGLTVVEKRYRLPHFEIERCLIVLSHSPLVVNNLGDFQNFLY